MTYLQEELEAESTNELEWQCQSQMDEDSGCETRESSSNHEEQLLKEATDCKAASSSQLKKSEELAAQLKQNMDVKQALMGGKRKESTTLTKNEVKIESRGRESQLHDEKYTQRKNSRTSSHEDKVEMQDITSKYEVVNYVDKKTWSGTQISSRRWSSSV